MEHSVTDEIRKELRGLADPAKARILQRFFKTGPGQYGEGDTFLGVTVPRTRQVAKKFSQVPLGEVRLLLYSGVHEERLVGLLILLQRYARALVGEKEKIVKFYLDNIKQVNNWDLVDLSGPNILGPHLMKRDRRELYRLAKSRSVWKRRIAIVSTLPLIRKGEFRDTLNIVELFLHDDHDLIHKAAGWMLREVGKRNAAA
jgi:3-methyladenine DNA glycosylase AlkD